jgi:cytochrome c-type biogenesis protein CcmH
MPTFNKASVRRAALLIALSVGTVMTMGAGSKESADARYNKLGHQMMCMCGCNQILIECNHVGCSYSERMLKELRAAIDRGDNDDLILQGFVQNYGNTVLSAPTTKGFNRVAWIMPVVIFFAALAAVVAVVRAWKHRVALAAPGTPGVTIPNNPEDEFRRRAREETEL